MVTWSKRSRIECKSEINMIPLLDILLVLLLIFMATNPIINQSIKIDLPDTVESNIINNNDDLPVIIEVYSSKQYNVIVENNRVDYLSPEQIVNTVKQYLHVNPKKVFLIGGSKDISYNEIIQALSLLRSAGVQSIGLMTHVI